MSRNMARVVAVLATLIPLMAKGTASAQFFGGYDPCQCIQPVAQAWYQTVPVTEYQEVRQTVQRPVVETKYVEQNVTAYRPVTEQRTASIPTTTYQDVTEYQTVTRDAGYWQNNYICNPKMAPCQYDGRPNFWGWLNRTGYAFRSSMTPRYTVQRNYVPQYVQASVPVTRRVAQHGTREVTYNVTRIEPYTTTQKVAVNSVKYVAEEVVGMRPVTVMRTVPIGTTATAFAVGPYGIAPSQTTLLPTPDRISQKKATPRTTNRDNDKFTEDDPQRDSNSINYKYPTGSDIQRSSYSVPVAPRQEAPISIDAPQASNSTKVPSVVRVGQWVSRRQRNTGPLLAGPDLVMAGAN